MAVLRRSVLRVTGSIYVAKRLDNTAPLNKRSGDAGEPLEVTLLKEKFNHLSILS